MGLYYGTAHRQTQAHPFCLCCEKGREMFAFPAERYRIRDRPPEILTPELESSSVRTVSFDPMDRCPPSHRSRWPSDLANLLQLHLIAVNHWKIRGQLGFRTTF